MKKILAEQKTVSQRLKSTHQASYALTHPGQDHEKFASQPRR